LRLKKEKGGRRGEKKKVGTFHLEKQQRTQLRNPEKGKCAVETSGRWEAKKGTSILDGTFGKKIQILLKKRKTGRWGTNILQLEKLPRKVISNEVDNELGRK